MPELEIEENSESGGFCDCCGNQSRTVWGYVYADGAAHAAYFVSWTCDKPDHSPNFDIIIGTWGNDKSNDKKLSSWILNTSPDSSGFVAIDSSDRRIADSDLVSETLSRDQVISDPNLKELATAIIDAIWIQDSRIKEITAWI